MPDPPPTKRQPLHGLGRRAVRQGYAELHCCTNFSFLEGASHPDELVQQAAELGLAALAVTDRNSLAGAARAHLAAKEVGLKLLIGAEVTPSDAPPIVLLAMNRAGYANLCRLLTLGRRRAPKGECELRFQDVADHARDLLGCVLLREHFRSPPQSNSYLGDGLIVGERAGVRGTESCSHYDPLTLSAYREAFGDRAYAVAELHHGPNDRQLLQQMRDAAHQARLPLVAANDVHYHVPERQFLQHVLTAIRHRCTVSELGDRRHSNAERYLKSQREMLEQFSDYPEAVARTIEVADRCSFSLDELRYEYPDELCPQGTPPLEFLKELTWEGARRRYPEGLPDKVRRLIEHELQLIAELRYEAYFLTVWDLMRFAREREILCQGRGSAANSAVCYCLEVTSVDPERIDVLFERFISKERNEAPDIDVDFEHERREEVLQYVYEKYGRDRAGMAATVITYRPRSAVRDVGKALGLSLDRVEVLAKTLERAHNSEMVAARLKEAGLAPNSLVARQLVGLVDQILGFPRHLSQHVGGMVLTRGPLCEMVPIENAAMPGRTVIEWDKDDLDALGILKVDCLSLGMLSAIRKCFTMIADHYQRPLTLATVPAEDPGVYEMVGRADTMGVFQIESRAQMSMLPRLRPNCFYDLVIEVAIVRPGPIQGDMVHPYLRRRNKEEKVDYPDDRIRDVLEKTLGVPIFQEQAMRLAVVAAGFTPGEADQLRRAMGAWRKQGIIDQFRQKLIEGMQSNGYSIEFAERLFNQIRGFGEYGFPESHAASFALLVYVSAWMKCYHPAAFTASLINSQPMGFYAPAQLVSDARKHGVEVLPVDVNFSAWDCTLERMHQESWQDISPSPPQTTQKHGKRFPAGERVGVRGPEIAFLASLTPTLSPTIRSGLKSRANCGGEGVSLRLGLRMIRGLSQVHAERIVKSRKQGGFTTFEEFSRRTRLTNAVLKQLAKADAFGSLALDRRQALWHSLPSREPAPLYAETHHPEPPAELPPMPLPQQIVADYQSAGLSLKGHPLQFLRSMLDELKVVPTCRLADLPPDRRYKVAGLVLLRQRPGTAKGITFVTIEDETGTANLIVRQTVWERYHTVAARAGAFIASGKLQRAHDVIHLLVDRLEDMTSLLADLNTRSRDFR